MSRSTKIKVVSLSLFARTQNSKQAAPYTWGAVANAKQFENPSILTGFCLWIYHDERAMTGPAWVQLSKLASANGRSM
jgi:hypothetical protein